MMIFPRIAIRESDLQRYDLVNVVPFYHHIDSTVPRRLIDIEVSFGRT